MSESERRRLPAWAQEASLGIFIHWGPYSIPAWAEPTGAWGAIPEGKWFAHNAYAEWYANTIRIKGSPAAQNQLNAHSGAPYDAFLDEWKAEAYDPADWAKLFREAGADYVVPVTKHHDGVTLWDAPGSNELNTVRRGPKRDLLAPLADAVRAENLRFGVYYSGGLDWSITDFPAIDSMAAVEDYRPNDEAYATYATAHVLDLIDRYQPSVIWNDINWPDAGKENGTLTDLFDRYREAVPDGIVNDRWGTDYWDYRTSEYAHDVHNEAGIGWEHNRGLGFSFGFNRIEDADLTLTPRELAQLYADVVSRGGRLLLNVGPEGSGVIPELQRRTLEGIAGWMAQVKPLTRERRPLTEEETPVLPDGERWIRGWMNGDRRILITDRPDEVLAAIHDEMTIVIGLPEEA